jgi:hypothetical protein
MENYKLKEQDYLDLWKYFSEDTAKIKDKLWTIASWLYALMSGVMGFVVKYQIEGKAAGDNAFWLKAMALTGILLSLYTIFMIREYGLHIRSGWKMTDFLRGKIDGLPEIWESRKHKEATGFQKRLSTFLYGKDDGEGLPPFVKRLQWLAVGYGVGFFLVLIYGMLK